MAAGNKGVNDGSGGQWIGQQMMEQRRMQPPTINASSKCEQWLATMRLRGQQLALAAKGGCGRRRDCHCQGGVFAALVVAEASWIWTTKLHATEGSGKQEDESVFCRQRQLLG